VTERTNEPATGGQPERDTPAENAPAEGSANASANAGPNVGNAREAKGAAHEVIGKLLGDDQAVRDGRNEQRAGADGGESPVRIPGKQSKTEQE
jgi:hypothetical protein